jgi:flagellar basal body-associated protein FliL
MIKIPEARQLRQRNKRLALILILSLMVLYIFAVAGVLLLN